jgi:hypothetical protein
VACGAERAKYFIRPKLALRKVLGEKLHGAYIEQPVALDQSLYVLISKQDDVADLTFLLGVLLSRLGAWYLRTKYAIYDKLYPWYTKKQLARFPVRDRDDHIVAVAEQLSSLHRRLLDVNTPHGKILIQREIDTLDRRLDRLVYEMYGLTDDEIAIVEQRTPAPTAAR